MELMLAALHGTVRPVLFNKSEQIVLKHCGRAMSVGIRQSGAYRHRDAEMRQIAVVAFQPMGDSTERIHSSKMTKQHGHELRFAGEAFYCTFRVVLINKPS